jgi:ABC-2 type transport system permease protein
MTTVQPADLESLLGLADETAAGEAADVKRYSSHQRSQLMRAFWAMIARELFILRRNVPSFLLQTGMQPLLFVLVFTFIMPKIGDVMRPGGVSFSSILLPGIVANAIVLNSMTGVTMSMIRELSYNRSIEDRMLAPLPLWALGVQKITWGALTGIFAGVVVFPIAYLVHAPGQRPQVHVGNWPLFLACMVLVPLLASSIGLFVGTIIDPRQINVLINLVMVPATLLGCVYYPWAALHRIPVIQYLVLINPVVYASEALRTVFTPAVPHMPVAVVLSVVSTALVGFLALGLRSFQRRLIG